MILTNFVANLNYLTDIAKNETKKIRRKKLQVEMKIFYII